MSSSKDPRRIRTILFAVVLLAGMILFVIMQDQFIVASDTIEAQGGAAGE